MIAWLAQWLVSGLAVAAAAAVAIRLVPTGAAAERHRLWWAALLAVVAPPLLAFAVPQPASSTDAQGLGHGVAAVPELALFSLTPPSWLAPLLAGAWAAWVLVALVRLGMSAVAVRSLIANSTELDDERLAAVVGRVRSTRVWSAPGLRGACAVGFVRPRIVVGAGVQTRLDADGLRLVVLHEAAHLARYDDWTRLALQLIVALAGFHPAIWFIARQLDHECEAACDQWVVAQTGSAVQYAYALVTVAAATAGAGRWPGSLAPGVLERRSLLSQRVARLVSGAVVPRAVRLVRATVGAGVIGLAALLTASIPPILELMVASPVRVLAALPSSATPRSFVPGVVSRRPVLSDVSPTVRAGSPRPDASPAERLLPVPAVLPPAVQATGPDARETSDHDADVLPEAPRLANPIVVRAWNPGPAREQASLGARAARAGTATGDAVGRAGQSIGRFLSRGGRAVSNRF